MTVSPYTPLILLAVLLVLFVWDRWRYDMVAVFGLLCAIFLGFVPVEIAFHGFGHPAVVLVAAALIISAGLKSSGALQAMMGSLPVEGKSLWFQLLVICGVTAFLSAFINNVAAVALMIPFVTKLAYTSKRSARLYLMPLAFASLLGGIITLIGTPPNIIIATYRAQALNTERFSMFDFTPVGLVLCIFGILFIAFFSRFFIKVSEEHTDGELLKVTRDFLTELQVGKNSPLIGMTFREILQRNPGCNFLGVKRGTSPMTIPDQFEKLEADDILIVEAIADVLELLITKDGLVLLSGEKSLEILQNENAKIVELLVPAETFSVGRSSKSMDLRWEYSINVLGIARTGERITRQLSDVLFHVGDIVLLQGQSANISRAAKDMGWVFLSERSSLFKQKRSIFFPPLLFAAGIVVSYLGYVDITVAFVGCSLIYVLLGYVRPNELYSKIEWPVIVLLACLIPIGEGLDKAGSLEIISNSVQAMVSGLNPAFILVIIMAVTMLLTNVINNAAAAIVMAPVAVELAKQLNVSPDSLLMAVALAASAAFITPIGHQSNALVMVPGGYSFKEYSYLGVPISILYLVLAVPCLLAVWPL